MKTYIFLIFVIFYCAAYDFSLSSGVRDGDRMEAINIGSKTFKFSELEPLKSKTLEDDDEVLILTELSSPAILTDSDGHKIGGGSIIGVNDDITVTARMYRSGVAEWKYVLLENGSITASKPFSLSVEVTKEEIEPWIFIKADPSIGFSSSAVERHPFNPLQTLYYITVNDDEFVDIKLEATVSATVDTSQDKFCYNKIEIDDPNVCPTIDKTLEDSVEISNQLEPFVFKINEFHVRTAQTFNPGDERKYTIKYTINESIIKNGEIIVNPKEDERHARIRYLHDDDIIRFDDCTVDEENEDEFDLNRHYGSICFKHKELLLNNQAVTWTMIIPEQANPKTGVYFAGIDKVFGTVEICKHNDKNDCVEMDGKYTNEDYHEYIHLEAPTIYVTVKFTPSEDFVGNVKLYFHTTDEGEPDYSALIEFTYKHHDDSIHVPKEYPKAIVHLEDEFYIYPSGEAYHRVPDILTLEVPEIRNTECGSFKLFKVEDDTEVESNEVLNPFAHYIVYTPNKECQSDKLCINISYNENSEEVCHEITVVNDNNDEDDDNDGSSALANSLSNIFVIVTLYMIILF